MARFLTVAVALLAVGYGIHFQRRVRIPEHLLHHPASAVPGLLTEAQRAGLERMAEEMGTFPTNANDLIFYKTRHEVPHAP